MMKFKTIINFQNNLNSMILFRKDDYICLCLRKTM